MNKRLHALGRLPKGVMNKTEAKYATLLDLRLRCGEILWYRFECMTFKLAKLTGYTPDFMVMLADGSLEAHEVKGAKAIFKDDARAKVKISADIFPIRFIVAYPIKGSTLFEYEVFGE